MKCLVVVFITLIVLIAADEEWKPITDLDILFKVHTDCIEESAVTFEQRRQISKNQPPDDKEVHAYFLCVSKKMGIFTEDKGFNVDRFISQLDVQHYAEKGRDIVTNCADSNEQNSTTAIWTFRVWKCLTDAKIYDVMIKRKKTA